VAEEEVDQAAVAVEWEEAEPDGLLHQEQEECSLGVPELHQEVVAFSVEAQGEVLQGQWHPLEVVNSHKDPPKHPRSEEEA